jgi:hypothetical protein
MKQNQSWRLLLADLLLVTAFALAIVIARGTHAADPPFHLATDSSEMQFGAHR